jgi:hypothetical protein
MSDSSLRFGMTLLNRFAVGALAPPELLVSGVPVSLFMLLILIGPWPLARLVERPAGFL